MWQRRMELRCGRAMAGALLLSLLLASELGAAEVFTNSFYVRLRGDPGPEEADKLALRTGFHNYGPVSIKKYYHDQSDKCLGKLSSALPLVSFMKFHQYYSLDIIYFVHICKMTMHVDLTSYGLSLFNTKQFCLYLVIMFY